jgi:NitT/TauT family transport system permease protein
MTATARTSKLRTWSMTLFWQILGLLIILFIWWIITDILHVWPKYIVPSPGAVWQEFRWGLKGPSPLDGKLLESIGNSMQRMLVSFAIGIMSGGIVGLFLSISRPLRDVLGAYLQGLQSIPSIAWVPLSLLFFGLTERAVYAVVILETFIPVALAVSASVLNVPPALRIAGRTLGARNFALITRVLLPGALPSIVTGLRTAWSFAWRALIGAELLTRKAGLGNTLDIGRNLGNVALVVETIIIIGVVGVLFDMLIRSYEGRIRRDYGLEVLV